MNGTEALISLIRTFDKAGVPYMIVGSYSSNFYGIPRSTKDADVVAVLQVQGADRLDWPYMEEWCANHQTLDLLAEAMIEAAPTCQEL
jgi:hypothetical protein